MEMQTARIQVRAKPSGRVIPPVNDSTMLQGRIAYIKRSERVFLPLSLTIFSFFASMPSRISRNRVSCSDSISQKKSISFPSFACVQLRMARPVLVRAIQLRGMPFSVQMRGRTRHGSRALRRKEVCVR